MTPLQLHVANWSNCQRCELASQRWARSQVVIGKGDVPAHVLFIGEAPGESEDLSGIPFDGPAGNLLDRIVKKAFVGNAHLTSAYTNLTGCFPRAEKETGRHAPPDQCIRACFPRVKEFVKLVQPRLIVLVGQLAKKWIPGQSSLSERSDGSLDWIPPDQLLEFCEMVHPSYILTHMEEAQKPLAIQRCIADLTESIGRISY